MTTTPDEGTQSKSPSPIPREARPYQGQRAGIFTRVVAMAVDMIVVIVIVAALYVAFAGFLFLLHPRSFEFPSRAGLTVPVISFVIAVPYLTLSWNASGRSFGNQLLGLRVVSSRGRRVGLFRALLRAVFCVVFPIGLLWAAIDRQNRSVQDLVLRTSVIYDWTAHAPTTKPIA